MKTIRTIYRRFLALVWRPSIMLMVVTGLPLEQTHGATTTNVLVVYSEAGIPLNANAWTWPSPSECSRAQWNGNFVPASAPPEGRTCWRTVSTCPYAGWGIFSSRNMTAFAKGELRFFLKSTTYLQLQLEGPQNRKATVWLESTGGQWKEIVVPISAFSGVDLTRIFGLFLITALEPTTFLVDHVRWVRDPAPTAPLVVRTNGLCPSAVAMSIPFELNATHTLTAANLPGYQFANWTDGLDAVLTNGASLRFVMRSNLVVAANYADKKRPGVVFTSPATKLRTTNDVIRVAGTASDVLGCITQVQYQINGGQWSTASGTTNWQTDVFLAPGTNLVRVYAFDAAGISSLTNELELVRLLRTPILLQKTGCGSITGAVSGQLSAIGRGFTIGAVPCAEYLLSNWTASISPGASYVFSDASVINVMMESNLVLQANFAPNPFRPVRGPYNGLFYESDGVRYDSSGFFSFTVNGRGFYGGYLKMGKEEYSFSGKFDLNGKATNIFAVSGGENLVAEWNVDLGGTSSNAVSGRVIGPAQAWISDLIGDRAPTYISPNASPYQGNYTIRIPGSPDPGNSEVPVGDGFGTVRVDGAGTLTFAGTLADGRPISQTVAMSEHGWWPLYFDDGRNSVVAWVKANANANPFVLWSERVSWIRLPNTNALYYPSGFETETTLVGYRYSAIAGKRILPLTNALIAFVGGKLDGVVTNCVRLTANNRITNCGPHGLSMTIATSNGTFFGTMTVPGVAQGIAFKGAVFQSDGFGSGFFRNGGESGLVFWGPTELFSLWRPAYSLHGINLGPYIDAGEDPNRNMAGQITVEELRSRLAKVAPYTRWVRSFGTVGDLGPIGSVAHELGLKAAVGAWLGRDEAENRRQIDSLIQLCEQGMLDLAIVGSEVLLRNDLTEARLIEYIREVKARLSTAGLSIPVTTADVHGIFLSHPALLSEVDVVFVNYYPYWEGRSLRCAMAYLHSWHQRIKGLVPEKQVVVSETGWPSCGERKGEAIPSPETAAEYFLTFVSWARANSVDYFYFSAYNEPWKIGSEGPQGKCWGLWDETGTLKPGMEKVFQGIITEDRWSGCPTEPVIDFFMQPDFISSNIPAFLVAGSAGPGTRVSLNGADIPPQSIDESGNFAAVVPLQDGDNALQIVVNSTHNGQVLRQALKLVRYDRNLSTIARRLLYVDVTSANGEIPNLNGTVVIDLEGNAVLGVIEGKHVRGMSPNGSEIYVDDRTVISTDRHEPLRSLPFTSPLAHNGFLVSPDGQRLYSDSEIVSVPSNQLSAQRLPVSVRTGSSWASTAVPGGPTISEDGRWILCQNDVALIDTVSLSATNTGITGYFMSDIGLSPDRTRIFVSEYSFGGGRLDVYDATTFQPVGTLNGLGDFAGQIQFAAGKAVVGSGGNPAWQGDGRLSVIDLASLNVISQASVPLADNLVTSERGEIFSSTGQSDEIQGNRLGLDIFTLDVNGQLTRGKTFCLGVNRFVASSGRPRYDQIRRIVYKRGA